MNKNVTFILFALFSIAFFPAVAQVQTAKEADDKIFTYVEVMPQFPGGQDSLMAYLGRTIKYPEEANKQGIQGLVVLSFVIKSNGRTSDIKVLKKLGYGTDEEAYRAVEVMPAWKPGKHNGKNVNVQYTLPIRFTL